MGKWAEMAKCIKERDNDALDTMAGRGGPTIENRIELADGRARDALITLLSVLEHLDAQDQDAARKEREQT